MSRKIKIGLLQTKYESRESYVKNQDTVFELGEQCLKNGADLVFFAEMYQYGDDGRNLLNDLPKLRKVADDWKERCGALAKKYNAYVVPWDYEIDADDNVYNSSYILNPNGAEVGRYRKVHLTYGEQMWGLKPGYDFPVFDTDIGKIGIMICFDNYWPESARILGLRGAELILYPLYGDTLIPQWELKMRVRAIDNHLYVAPCQIGNNYAQAYTGLVSPNGDVLCKLDHAPCIQIAEAELGRPVITSTMARPDVKEDLSQYLNRVRNVAAYAPLLEERQSIWPWDDIFLGKRP